ncbi:hypothetical protein [Kurthia senegalensis]|uniref:hypothetical protein n=1 Tax=Kurthia senegalensis TaxID=1033740 RepID=UPI00028886C6|nr:hypothetical protein [Kurthia senegalensis]
MATIEKRRERKINASKRMALLNRQTEIYERNCSTCPFNDRDKFEECDKCPLSQELRSIGSELFTLANDSREGRKELLIAKLQESELTSNLYQELRSNGVKDAEIVKFAKVTKNEFYAWKRCVFGLKAKEIQITKEQYHEYKKQFYTDDEISEMLDVSPEMLKKWKRENGILQQNVARERRARIYTEHTKYRLVKRGIVVATGTFDEIMEQTGFKK